MDNYHVVYTDGIWKFKKQHAERATATFNTKAEALDYAIAFMHRNGGSLKIHRMDGTFEEERTYPGSAYPHRSKG
jgi:hypothetical protein